ncbi:two-component system sensor histidine kinase RcsC [Rahnella sp. C60]|uniref:two-component system sensor histidine kinase RcsC n=1 Tax=Rahnella perminowiae TaxID=2816244 RepID=UPI001C27EE73|nr:two-component system sensor histidine kinase RcsC [Rahnella perminowiae]MBU9810509.1 two-component system sensor histidine kinase RcsC [Rahnella perminowiae]MBU9815788.1 two-component system sensor histidine kinase RcsC [Rahnella perminowiae]
MKYLASFRTTLRISRYLFRVLALMLWTLGVLLTTFYVLNIFHNKESEIRDEDNLNYDLAQSYIKNSNDVMHSIKFMAENRLSASMNGLDIINGIISTKNTAPTYLALFPESDCSGINDSYRNSLASLGNMIHYWKDNFSDAYDLSRVFFISGENLCLVDFGISNEPFERESQEQLKSLHEKILQYRNAKSKAKENSLYWVSQSGSKDSGNLYVLTPIYVGNKLEALMGIQQNLRAEDLLNPNSQHTAVTLLDEDDQPLLEISEDEHSASSPEGYPQDSSFFGYVNGYKDLVYKKPLTPSSLSVVYSMPFNTVIDRFKILIFNAVLLNIFSGLLLFILAWVFERKMFLPAEENAFRLEEHEQFNHKIVASAPVGISILRISDGVNILSNELAHNYISMLTQEDRQRITRIICDQQTNFVDVITKNNNNIQLSFVHSRYRNEDVAICVLIDVSARVKMEESLQEMANAAEQASQSKSMFLATVSHELRTPLYGIIGNLDLLQTQGLPQGVDRLVTAMNNSSALLLKIISDILDFSKIESEQLKIEPQEFSCREVITHIAGNYLPLVVKKRLGLYCFIEHNVPLSFNGDPVRLQQVISNILNNAIKFTDTGCIVLNVRTCGNYLEFQVRDTGVGIPEREITRLFDPFFQVGTGVQRHFQGTGLGLAICEKLINLMDGDIEVESEPGLGSSFTVRIPLYNATFPSGEPLDHWQDKTVWLDVRNAYLESYLMQLMRYHGANVQRCEPELQSQREDVLITDTPLIHKGELAAQIEFSIDHIGPPVETRPGYWVHSTSTPLEITALLNRIYRLDTTPEEEGCAAPEAAVAQDYSDITLLVVDDHPINRRLLADQLGTMGYVVITANDGIDALDAMRAHEIDIVLSDVNMPRLDGYGLTAKLRELGHTLPVIGVTANALAEQRQRCLEAGMDNCLSKPVTLETLRDTLSFYSALVRKKR